MSRDRGVTGRRGHTGGWFGCQPYSHVPVWPSPLSCDRWSPCYLSPGDMCFLPTGPASSLSLYPPPLLPAGLAQEPPSKASAMAGSSSACPSGSVRSCATQGAKVGWGGGLYLEDEPFRAEAFVLVHLVDDQEDDAGEEGQREEDQHRDLQADAASGWVCRDGWTDRQGQRHTGTPEGTKARNRGHWGQEVSNISLDNLCSIFIFIMSTCLLFSL